MSTDNLTVEEICSGVFHVRATTQYHLTSTFMRLQEFYESPHSHIRNKYFTHEQYMDTCVGTARSSASDKFTYFEDWAGFNVPGNVFNKWVELFSADYLWEKERRLVEMISERVTSNKFYVIGTSSGDDQPTVIDHELSHAWFYLDRKYKQQMLKHVRSLSKTAYKHLRDHILDEGYDLSVIDDEIQAYLATNQMVDTVDMFPEKYRIPWSLVADFQQTFAAAREVKIDKDN